jgi:hypothetical protein
VMYDRCIGIGGAWCVVRRCTWDVLVSLWWERNDDVEELSFRSVTHVFYTLYVASSMNGT